MKRKRQEIKAKASKPDEEFSSEDKDIRYRLRSSRRIRGQVEWLYKLHYWGGGLTMGRWHKRKKISRGMHLCKLFMFAVFDVPFYI